MQTSLLCLSNLHKFHSYQNQKRFSVLQSDQQNRCAQKHSRSKTCRQTSTSHLHPGGMLKHLKCIIVLGGLYFITPLTRNHCNYVNCCSCVFKKKRKKPKLYLEIIKSAHLLILCSKQNMSLQETVTGRDSYLPCIHWTFSLCNCWKQWIKGKMNWLAPVCFHAT